jgi:hypothetical protein
MPARSMISVPGMSSPRKIVFSSSGARNTVR